MFRRDKIVDKQPENVIEVTVIDSDGMNEYQFIQSPAAENIGIIKFS